MNFDKLSGIASLLGLVFTIAGYFTLDNPIHVWLLSFTALIFMFLCWYSFKRYNIAKRYLDGEAEIRNIHNKLMLDISAIKAKDFNGIILELTTICTDIASAFEKIKGNKTSVCIKYTNGDIGNPYVKTLCRDHHSRNNRDWGDESNYFIFQNTDFTHILKQLNNNKKFSSLFYCENWLPYKHQYNNTHLDSDKLSTGFWSYLNRNKKWPLPYKSAIVVPFISPDVQHLDGFLCIDSPALNGFEKNRDVVIMQEIALFMRELICFTCTNHLN